MGRDAILDRRRAQDARVAHLDDARPLGPFLDVERELDRAQLRRGPPVGAERPPPMLTCCSPSGCSLAVSALATCHSSSSSSRDRVRSSTSRSAAWRSTFAKRAANLALAPRRAASESMPSLRPRLTRTIKQVAELLAPLGVVLGRDELGGLLGRPCRARRRSPASRSPATRRAPASPARRRARAATATGRRRRQASIASGSWPDVDAAVRARCALAGLDLLPVADARQPPTRPRRRRRRADGGERSWSSTCAVDVGQVEDAVLGRVLRRGARSAAAGRRAPRRAAGVEPCSSAS